MKTITLKLEDEKKIIDFCSLNDLDVDEFMYICFKKGFDIERYGLLGVDETNTLDKQNIELNVLNEKLIACNEKRGLLEETLFKLKAEIMKNKKND